MAFDDVPKPVSAEIPIPETARVEKTHSKDSLDLANEMIDIKISRVTSESELDSIECLSAKYEGVVFNYSKDDIAEYKQRLQEPHAFQVILKDNNKPVAFFAASEKLFPDYLFIYETLIDQSVQRMGLGKLLVTESIKFAREEGLKGVYVETEFWNLPAQSLYKHVGFEIVDNPNWTEGITFQIKFDKIK